MMTQIKQVQTYLIGIWQTFVPTPRFLFFLLLPFPLWALSGFVPFVGLVGLCLWGGLAVAVGWDLQVTPTVTTVTDSGADS